MKTFLHNNRMLRESNAGFLNEAPDKMKQELHQFKYVESHAELMNLIKGAI